MESDALFGEVNEPSHKSAPAFSTNHAPGRFIESRWLRIYTVCNPGALMGIPSERQGHMRLLWLSLLVLTPVLTPAALRAQHSYTPSDIQEGGRLFRVNCVLCHGPEGDQVPGIDLGHGRFRQAYSENALVKIIENGIAGTGMPPNNLQDFQAEIVVAYLRSMATAGHTVTSNGDAARGKALFEGKGNCASCHRVNGVGSRVGPDLSDIAALRRTVEIERSLIEPNEEVLPQNRMYRAVTAQGETITGRLLNIDTFTVQILDSKERLLSLQRADLRESGFVKDSPMPSYRDKFSSQELADVVAYLVTLKGL
jgi:putative heme-binding domain-containing protein